MVGLNYLFSPERKTSFMRRAFSLISEKLHSKKYFSGLKKEGAFQNAPLWKVVSKQPTLPTVQKIRTESGALKCRFPPLCARRTFFKGSSCNLEPSILSAHSLICFQCGVERATLYFPVSTSIGGLPMFIRLTMSSSVNDISEFSEFGEITRANLRASFMGFKPSTAAMVTFELRWV